MGFDDLRTRIEQDESQERLETVDTIMNEINRDKTKTEIAKQRFIEEMKHGLGEQMLKNPNAAKKIKRSLWQRTKNSIINFFKMF